MKPYQSRNGSSPVYTAAAILAAALFAACSGGISGSASTPAMDLLLVSNGFGQILPHQTLQTDGEGNVGTDVMDIRTLDDLYTHVSGSNPVHATPRLSEDARLPSGHPGNQFIYAKFTNDIDITSVLSDRAADQANAGLTGSIVVEAVDPLAGTANYVQGRAFINGKTYAGSPVGEPPRLPLQTWVTLENGAPTFTAVDNNADGVPDGLGFPGTLNSFSGMGELFGENTFVFIADSDNNLATLETFPSGYEIRVNIYTSVLDITGKEQWRQAVASTSVGTDVSSPESLFTPPPIQAPLTVPQDGDSNVDPLTDIRLFFTEPIQPASLGNMPSNRPPELSGSVQVQFGPETSRVQVPFFVRPASALDLTTWTIEPAFNFPGEGPEGQECAAFDTVDIIINSGLFTDLVGNANTLSGTSSFRTGEGPGLVNAPITPDVVYVGRQGASNSLSVIDLNGFGGGTGDPTWLYQNYAQGNSNFPNDPNVFFQGSQLLPPLLPGTCTFNGGSAGVFTLTKDSNLDDRLVRAPMVGSVDDVALGSALDLSFNNGPAPFGCQAGGGNICATTGIKTFTITIQGGTLNPGGGAQAGAGVVVTGVANLVSWAPHPNPPPLDFPPMCIAPYLLAQEPTSIDTTLPPPAGPGLQNLLNPGNPFPDRTDPTVPFFNVPPTGLLAEQTNSYFQGPSLPDITIQNCIPYGIRQQVGHFMYVLDRSIHEVVVLNSNRMTIIDRIGLPDPTSLAMGTNLDLLAVSSQSTNSVYFIDTDPSSATFHEVIKITQVGDNPRGIAWEPGNEDILVCNEASSSVSIISAFSLEVRKELVAFLSDPFEVCITPRQTNFGFFRNVYFAYILNRSGEVAVFESGPNEVNGWGYDDLIGTTPYTFKNPKTIQPDYLDLRGGFWVLHEGPFDFLTEDPGEEGEPAATNCAVVTGTAGQLPLNVTSLSIPGFRDMAFGIKVSLDSNTLSGIPVDMAFDNLLNLGGSVNFYTPFSAGQPCVVNGKSIVRPGNPGVPTCSSRFAFFGVPNSSTADGAVDVISLSNLTRFDVNPYEDGIQSIPVQGVRVLADYFRQ